jgi:CHAT domain-containing protein
MSKIPSVLISTVVIFISASSLLYSMIQPDSVEAEKYYRQGKAFWGDVKYDSSNFYYEKAAEIFKKLSDWEKYIDCQKNIGINYRYLGNFSDAFNHLNDGLAALNFLKENSDSLRSELYNTVGSFYYEKGDFGKAYKYYTDMLDINERLFGTENVLTGRGYQNIGLIYYRTGDYEKALEYLGKALSIWQSTIGNEDPRLGNCYTNLSEVYFLKQNYSKSIEYTGKALKIWKDKLGEGHPYIAKIYNNLARAYTFDGKNEKALDYYYKAMQIRRDYAGEESPAVALSYASIGYVFTRLGNYNNAEYFLRKGIDIYKKVAPSNQGLADAYIFSGNLYRTEKNYITAVTYYDSALSIVWHGYNPDYPDLNSLKKILSAEQCISALSGRGRALAEEGETTSDVSVLKKSLSAFETALAVVRELEPGFGSEEPNLIFVPGNREIYKRGVDVSFKLYKLLKDPKYIESSFLFAEGEKTAILSESVDEAGVNKFKGLPDSLFSIEKDLRADITLYETRLKESEETNDSASIAVNKNLLLYFRTKYNELLSHLEKNFPSYYNLRYPETINIPEDIMRLLPQDAALIEYFTGDSSITIFSLTRKSVNAVTVDCDSTFLNEVRKFRAALKNSDYIKYLSSAYALYSKLIEPVTGFIKDKDRLYIIPDAILAYLPFDALLTKNYSGRFKGDYQDLDYLIKDYQISYHYSSELLKEALLHKSNNQKTSFAGFATVFTGGNKDLDRTAGVVDTNLINNHDFKVLIDSAKRYSYLSELEVKSIGNLFKQNDYPSDIYVDKASMESKLRSGEISRYKFIHFATYGIINEDHPYLSGLVFYNQEDSLNDDGILSAGEIYNSDIKADLLVLSRCESLPGKIVKGDGIYGFVRAFLYAGAHNIVVSLWPARDKSATILMLNFYKNILDGMDYSSALREAKLDIIDKNLYSNPLEWSSYILVGR